jgi:hypothetical protein
VSDGLETIVRQRPDVTALAAVIVANEDACASSGSDVSDPHIPLNCWTCGRPLTYILTLPDGTHSMCVRRNGRFKLTPAGLEEDTSEIAHESVMAL